MQAELVGISFATAHGEAAYLPLAHHYAGAPQQLDRGAALARLKPLLENPEPRIIGQHLKYDRHVLANYGIRLGGVADDTLLQSYVLEAHQSHELGNLASRHLGLATISYDDVTGKGASRIGFEQVAIERASEYAAEDTDVTLRVRDVLAPQIAAVEKLDFAPDEPVAEILFRMERTGVLLDATCSQCKAANHKMLSWNSAHQKPCCSTSARPSRSASCSRKKARP
jgi:DNA polymerase-1